MSTETSATSSRWGGSQDMWERAKRSLSGGVSTSIRRDERPNPLYFREARGAHLTDVDGNEYIDFVCGYGPIILGHGHPVVAEAVATAARGIQQIGGQHEAEIELAETLCRLVPSFQRLRLSLTGSEAVHSAMRLARAATDRSLVVKFAGHYHGWFDNILTATADLPPAAPQTLGQPPGAVADVLAIEWNDEQALRRTFADLGGEIAALIMEPYPCNAGVIPPVDGFLDLARALTTEAGAVLIFDEVITGFRLGLGGAQAQLDVIPDLTVVAKAMGNGFPVSAFGGASDLMELVSTNAVFHAGTFNGGGISVAAALATIGELETGTVYADLAHHGSRLRDGLTDVAQAHGRRLVTQGPGPVFFAWFLEEGEVRTFRDHLRADFAAYAEFSQAMLDEGVRIIPAGRWYLNAAHTADDVDRTLEAADRAFARL